MVTLREMSPAEVAAVLPGIFEGYVEDRVDAGEDPADARLTATSQRATLFPDDAPAEGQHLMHVLDGDQVVGLLWMGRPFSGPAATWFVFFVRVDEALRGRGYGRAAMYAAEDWTRERGGTRVALNVFGPNVTARALYDSLGYQVLATAMYKDLGG